METALLESVLPFFIVFAVAAAVARRTQFEKQAPLIGLVLASATVAIHLVGGYPSGFNPVVWLNVIIPYFAFTLVALLALAIILVLLGVEADEKLLRRIIVVLVAIDLVLPDTLIIAFLLGTSADELPGLGFLNNPEIMNGLIAVVVFSAVVWFVARKSPGEAKG